MKNAIRHLMSSFVRQSQTPTNLVAVSYIVQNGIRLASTLVLTRLLAPEAYAIIGLVASLAFVVTMLTDVGFQAFMLRHERLGERAFHDTMWTIRLLRSCLLSILFFCLADTLGIWLEKPEAIFALRIFSLTFIIEGLVPISNITGLAGDRIKDYCIVDMGVAFCNLITCVAFALIDPSSYSLVYAGLATSFCKVILFRIFLPDSFLVWSFDFKIFKDVLTFGRYIIASSAITLIILQIDKIGLLKLLDSDRLGAYFLAVSIAMVPRGLASAIASKSLYPTYSRTGAEVGKFDARELYASRRFLDKLFPAGCLLGLFLAPWIVSILYDPRYSEVATFLGLLLFGLIPFIWNMAINEFLVARGWTSTTFKSNVVRLMWILAVALPFLIQGRVMLFLIAMGFTEYCAYLYLSYRIFKIGFGRVKEELFCVFFAIFSIVIFIFSYSRMIFNSPLYTG
jgi:lipopolysaccharide exporter